MLPDLLAPTILQDTAASLPARLSIYLVIQSPICDLFQATREKLMLLSGWRAILLRPRSAWPSNSPSWFQSWNKPRSHLKREVIITESTKTAGQSEGPTSNTLFVDEGSFFPQEKDRATKWSISEKPKLYTTCGTWHRALQQMPQQRVLVM